MFVEDFAEVIDGITSITIATVSETEPAGRVAGIAGSSAVSGRNRHSSKAHGIQCEKDIAAAVRVQSSDVDLRRIRLVEHVEEPSPELNLLRLIDVEVL